MARASVAQIATSDESKPPRRSKRPEARRAEATPLHERSETHKVRGSTTDLSVELQWLYDKAAARTESSEKKARRLPGFRRRSKS